VTIKFYNRILLYNILTATKCRYVIDIVNHVIIIPSGQTISQVSTMDSTKFQSNIRTQQTENIFQVSFIFQFVQFLLRLSSAQHPQISHLYSSNTFSNKCQFEQICRHVIQSSVKFDLKKNLKKCESIPTIVWSSLSFIYSDS
jgi:hypothetical protein